jgi:glutamate/tyrosine decarboxylase-like PLP-dependent enzyme
VEILHRSTLNQGLLRFRDPCPAAGNPEHDRHTDAVIQAINATGVAFFSGTTWREARAMRVSVVNWRTDADDVRRTVEAVRGVLAGLGVEQGFDSLTRQHS